jgi:cytoskeletal protein CcmA (bactofilin family)
MKRRILIRLFVLFCLLLPAGAAAQSRSEALIIPVGQTYAGNLATLTRDIRVEGIVTGDVTSWSGTIEIAGRVGGDVVSYSGQVTLLAGAQVGGHILASGGALRLDAGASVAGQAIRGDGGGALASLLDLFAPSDGGGSAAVGRALFAVALGVFLLAFMLLGVAFWPRRTAAASLMLRRAPGHALLMGLLTTLLLALALPALLALLAATLIGMPLIVVLLALAQVPYIYGLATLAQARGVLKPLLPAASARPEQAEQLAYSPAWSLARSGDGPTRATIIAAALLALLIALGAALAPLWGLALFYVLASPGLGAILLSRGGLLVAAYD